jgi:hypothetical protein
MKSDDHLTEGRYAHGFGMASTRANVGPLKQRFIFPPYSTWNTRDGDWMNRRRLWMAKGIQSELGRDGKLTYNIPMELSDGRVGNRVRVQTSVFDPVVCELAYGWWCKPGGVVLDPFAGGSVRGIVASVLGKRYWGCELRAEQVQANREQVNEATRGQYAPKWVCGDSAAEVPNAPLADFVFSCPPYGNLEKYSDDPADISNMTYEQFLEVYGRIIAASVARLRDNRFACFVVANYRDGKARGLYRDFVGDTVRAFAAAGCDFYNEGILINSIGSAAMRANTSFVRGNRKLVKLHQNVLVFVKGDPAIAAQDIPADSGVATGQGAGDEK